MDKTDDYLLQLILKNLEELTKTLNKLNNFTNGEISGLKSIIEIIKKDIDALKHQECPKNKEAILEIIDIDRLRENSKRPKQYRDVIFWIFGITGTIITITIGVMKILEMLNK